MHVLSLGWVDPLAGGENGNSLQYYCLENPMDRGVWWATVHGAAKSWTELSDQHFQVSKERKKRKTTCLLFLHLLSLGHFLLNSIMEDEELTLSLLLSFYTPFSSLHCPNTQHLSLLL